MTHLIQQVAGAAVSDDTMFHCDLSVRDRSSFRWVVRSCRVSWAVIGMLIAVVPPAPSHAQATSRDMLAAFCDGVLSQLDRQAKANNYPYGARALLSEEAFQGAVQRTNNISYQLSRAISYLASRGYLAPNTSIDATSFMVNQMQRGVVTLNRCGAEISSITQNCQTHTTTTEQCMAAGRNKSSSCMAVDQCFALNSLPP